MFLAGIERDRRRLAIQWKSSEKFKQEFCQTWKKKEKKLENIEEAKSVRGLRVVRLIAIDEKVK